MLRSLNIVFLIISLVLFFNAPVEYHFTFCLAINLLFVLQNVLYFLISRRSLVSFEFFFMFAFYFVNFIYPVAYYQTDPTFGLFRYEFNHNIISKATAIAYVAYTCYMLGLTLKRIEPERELSIDTEVFSKSFFTNLLVLFVALSVYYISSIGYAFFQGYEWYVEADSYSPIVAFINMSASLFAMFLFFREKRMHRISNSLLLLFFIGIYLLSGSRHLPLGLMIIFIVAFHEKVRRIPSAVFIAVVISGVIVLYAIQITRIDGVMEATDISETVTASVETSVFDFASDLIYNNRNLYVLVDFADNVEHTYGLTMLQSFLSLVPFVGTLVSGITGIPLEFMHVAGFNTFLEFGMGSTFGLGGNLVADVYLAFGFWGILIFFTFLGLIMAKVIRLYKTHVIYYIVYFTMVGNAVFMNRESFFLPLRPILYSIVMFWILNRLFRNLSERLKFVPLENPDEDE